jgi:hypothetical protein
MKADVPHTLAELQTGNNARLTIQEKYGRYRVVKNSLSGSPL